MKFELNNYHRNISDDELIEDIQRVYEKLRKDSLKTDEYNRNGKYHASTICKRFGNWSKSLELAGIRPASYQRNNIAKDELIEDIKHVSSILKKNTVTSGDYKQFGSFDRTTLLKKFGTWKRCLELAGLEETGFDKDITIESLLEEIETVWIALGRQPTTTDIKKGCSKYSLNTYSRRFGSWRKALEIFVDFINEEEASEQKNDIQDDIVAAKDNNSIIMKHKTVRDINLRLRFKVLSRDFFKCKICGASPAFNEGVILHVDHIIPWAKGGETTIDNLQTLCSKCNLGKSDL